MHRVGQTGAEPPVLAVGSRNVLFEVVGLLFAPDGRLMAIVVGRSSPVDANMTRIFNERMQGVPPVVIHNPYWPPVTGSSLE